jgi:hypothetical protein
VAENEWEIRTQATRNVSRLQADGRDLVAEVRLTDDGDGDALFDGVDD